MATVPEIELEQKVHDLTSFVKDFHTNKGREFVYQGRGFKISIFDGDVNLEFRV